MKLQSLQHQLLRDLKASWQKTAVLAALLLVGGVIWTGQLVEAIRGSAAGTETAVTQPAAQQPPDPVSEITRHLTQHSWTAAAGRPPKATWKQAERLMETDPLVRSAEVAALEADPFRIDEDQFPPPILFSEEPKQSQPTSMPEQPQDSSAPAGLVLKSTIVGIQRRAAWINSKLYFQGSEIRVGDQTFRLTAVHPKKVVIQRGSESFELKLIDRAARHSLDVQAPAPNTVRQ